jgi:hypothetical protein
MKLGTVVGLNVPALDIIEGEHPLFIVERFDRPGVLKRDDRQVEL